MQGNPPAKGNCLTAGGCADTRRRSVGMGLVRIFFEFKSRLLQNVAVREVKLQSSLHGAKVFFVRGVTRPKKVDGCSSKATEISKEI